MKESGQNRLKSGQEMKKNGKYIQENGNRKQGKTQRRITLCGQWMLESVDKKIKCPVEIPGSVLSAVTACDILKNPYDRMNEYEARAFLDQDFVFYRTFEIVKGEEFAYELCCDGIDTIADICINDVLLRSVDNMHRRYQIACTDVLRDGRNEIRICFHSAIRYIREYTAQPGKEITYTPCGAMENNQYIRKAHSMFGWDWGPQLPDLGIWRDIYIHAFSKPVLDDIKIKQVHSTGHQKNKQVLQKNEAEYVEITLEASVKTTDGEVCTFQEAVKKIPQLRLQAEIITPEGERLAATDGQCRVMHPELWWPHRYGKQPLYTVKVMLLWQDKMSDRLSDKMSDQLSDKMPDKISDSILDEKQYRIGLRTLTVSRQKDLWGEEFAFCVNGVRIFAKGANYIPQDCIYSRITPQRIYDLLDTAVTCGFNMIRVWGGGYYPSEIFYDACDERGLIVWQDFMYACNIYELTDAFRENIIAETRDNVRRLRHHASLGIWCGNNEMESAWDHWGGFCEHPKALREDYLTMFEKIIPQIVQEEDPQTFYWPSSPSSGGAWKEPDSDDMGDRHYWDVWHGEKPFTDYANYYFRFCSEFGFQSFPCIKTIRTFTLPQDRNIFSEVMESHQKNGAANGKILRYISENFLYPKDFESLIYVSQILQGLAIKEGVEHWRRNRGRCMGAIYWQFNDNWPVASWSGVDYYGRWKALQYMARHFYADILGSLKEDETGVYTPYVQNETLHEIQSEVTLYVKDMDGTVLYEKGRKAVCKALSVTAAEPVYLQNIMAGKEREVFTEAVFRHSDGSVSRQVCMPAPYKYMRIKKAMISHTSIRKGNLLLITLQSSVPAFFVQIETDVDLVLSDNYMHLTNGKEWTVTGYLPEGYEGTPEIHVRSLCDSYEF